MAKYGKEDFVALVALDVIHAICMEGKAEAGAPHGNTLEETDRDMKLSDLTSVPGEEIEKASGRRGVNGRFR